MEKAFDMEGTPRLDIRLASGDIDVDATGDGRVTVELIAHDEESQRLVDEARIERDSDTIVVEVPNKRGGFSFGSMFGRSGVSCRVRCPEGTSVAASTKSADLRVRGTVGGLSLRTASGDLEAADVTGDVNVKSASGDTVLRTVGGRLNVQSASGDIHVRTTRGPVSVQTASGDVEIESADGDVSATAVSGDVALDAVVRGDVSAQCVSGDVRIGVRRGSKVYLDCNTLSGDTASELEVQSDAPAGDGPLVEIRAKTVSGDILITRAPAPVNDDAQEVHA
jgi:DUF4097 and DUF4098 domain-containing protein YvlB